MKLWTKEETDYLLRWTGKKTLRQIANDLDRHYEATKTKLQGLRRCLNDIHIPIEPAMEINSFTPEIKEKTSDIILLGEEIVKKFQPLKLDLYNPPKNKNKDEEYCILDLSDMHIGMINKVFDSGTEREEVTYNHEIFKHEMEMFIKGIGEIYRLLSSAYKLDTLYINCLGDIITNDRIFPEQTFEIEKVVGLQVWDAISYVLYFINYMKNYFRNVVFTGMVGNHGRSQPDFYNEPVQNNFEYFIYRVIQKQFEDDKRVKVIVPETRRFIIDIAGHKHLLEHGDSFRGTTENYIEQQVKNLFVNVGNFDVLDFGHFHKLKERELSDKVVVKQNGCWISKDNYAFKMFKDYSVAKQWFYGCNEKRSVTWSFKLDFNS